MWAPLQISGYGLFQPHLLLTCMKSSTQPSNLHRQTLNDLTEKLSDFQSDIVIGCHLSNASVCQISSLLDLPRSTVSAVIVKWKRPGATAAQPRSGRPHNLTEWDHQMLKHLEPKNGLSSVAKPNCPTSVPDLTNALVAEWKQVPLAMFQHLVESLPRSVDAVIAAKVFGILLGSPLPVAKAAATLPGVHTKHETIQNDIIQNIIRQEQLKDRTTYIKKKAHVAHLSMHTYKLSRSNRGEVLLYLYF